MQINFDKISYFPSHVNVDGVSTVENLSFELEGSGLTGVMGDSDSGKTTLLYLLSALLRPDKGHILVDGVDINSKKYKRSDKKPCCAFVMRQAECLLNAESVERELALVLRGRGMSEEEKQERINYAKRTVGLDFDTYAHVAPASLARHYRYMVSLACALVLKPDILLLDEPMLQLDAKGRKMLLELIEKLVGEGCHIIVATNDADFLAEHANQILILRKGQLVRKGSPKEIFANYFDLIRNQIPVPKVKKTAQMLRERDVNMPANVVEYEQFINRLKIIMWRKQR